MSEGRSKQAVDEGYSVGVQNQVQKKKSDKEYLTYPEDGNKLPADQVMMYKTICGHLLNFENMIEISETVRFSSLSLSKICCLVNTLVSVYRWQCVHIVIRLRPKFD